MIAIAWVLGIIVVVIVALLAVPLDVRFALDTARRPAARVQLGWLWSAVHVWLPTTPRVPRTREPRAQKPTRVIPKARAALGTPGVLDAALGLVRRTFGCIHVHWLHASVDVGFPDPVDTGLLCGVAQTMIAPLRLQDRGRVHVELRPDFLDERLDARGDGEVRVVPVELLAVIVRGLFTRPVLRALWAMR